MKKAISVFSQWIIGQYIVYLIKYYRSSQYHKALNHAYAKNLKRRGKDEWEQVWCKFQKKIFPVFLSLLFPNEKERIDLLFFRGDFFKFSAGEDQRHAIVYRMESWWKVLKHSYFSRSSAKNLLEWLIDIEFFKPQIYTDDKEMILIMERCARCLHISDLEYFLERFLLKCKEYHLDQRSWCYSSIGPNMVQVLEYLSYACFRTDKLDDVADLIVNQKEFNRFDDWNRAMNFYFRSGKQTAVQKIKNLGQKIFSEQWCNDYEWRPIGPYSNTLAMELAREICIKNDLYSKDPANELVVFVHEWFVDKEVT